MRLTTTSGTTQIILPGVPTLPLDVVVDFDNLDAYGLTSGLQATSVTASGATIIMGSPPASTVRDMSKLTLHNPNDAIEATEIAYHDGTNTFVMWKGTLPAGGGLQYNKNSSTPWTVISNTGVPLGTVTTPKVLGQAMLASETLTDVYAVPTATRAIVQAVTLCNQAAVPARVQLAVAVAGLADTPKQYLYKNFTVPGNETLLAEYPITLGPTDVVRVYASTANVSVTLFGVELT